MSITHSRASSDAWSYGKDSGDALVGNVVTYCAQSGSIESNHSCAQNYTQYLAQLATSWGG